MRCGRMTGKAAWAATVLTACVLCAVVYVPVRLHAADAESHLTAAILHDFPPLYETDEHGNHVGFALDVLENVAKRAGFSYTLLPVSNWAEAMDAVASGQADFVPGIGISAVRKERFIFTDVFETIPVVCFVRSETQGISGIRDLSGYRTAVINRSAAQTILGRTDGLLLTPFDSIDEALFSLLAGKVDAFVFPEEVLLRKAREIGVQGRIKAVGDPLTELKRGYLLSRGDTQLRDRLNKALREFVGSPEYNDIYTKWWLDPEPSWTLERVVMASAVLLVATVVLFAFWRWHSVSVLNKRLHNTMEERLQVQRKLQASEDLLNKAQELTIMGSFERDLITGEGHWSAALFKMLGHPLADKPPSAGAFIDQIHPEDRDRYRQSIVKATPEEPNDYLEFRFNPIDGDEYRYATCLLSFEFDTEGRPLKRMGTIQDITERKQFEHDLREAKEKAEAASRAKSEFLANMSHELRTPLNGAMGMLQLMALDELNPEHQDYVKTALTSCKNLARLINDILDLSKVEANKLVLSLVDFNPTELLHSVHETFIRLAQDKGIQFNFEVADDLPKCVVGDPARLRQVLFNLVGNAIKFTESGAVTVKVSPVALDDDGMCRILFSVVDTGIGIPDEMLDKIFGAFTQVDGAYTRKFQGTGLGLHIVKRLAELMGGNVSVESELGNGTAVHFTAVLQVVNPWSKACENGKKGSLPKIDPKHILIVEDERVNQLAISRFVERLGHSATCAVNGKDGMEKLADNDVDMILMDIQMPIMNGIDATKAIRSSQELGEKRDIPIVALTAHAMSGDKETFLAAGMNDYLAKPVNIEDLNLLLAHLFSS